MALPGGKKVALLGGNNTRRTERHGTKDKPVFQFVHIWMHNISISQRVAYTDRSCVRVLEPWKQTAVERLLPLFLQCVPHRWH